MDGRLFCSPVPRHLYPGITPSVDMALTGAAGTSPISVSLISYLVPNKRLLPLAQMKLPGKAWPEFDLQHDTLVQTARFIPHGLVGRLYWYAVLPFHSLVFPDLCRKNSDPDGSRKPPPVRTRGDPSPPLPFPLARQKRSSSPFPLKWSTLPPRLLPGNFSVNTQHDGSSFPSPSLSRRCRPHQFGATKPSCLSGQLIFPSNRRTWSRG